MVAPLIIAAGISAAGALASANANRNAAEEARFQPFNVAGPGGSVGFEGQNINLSLGNQEQQLRNQLFDQTFGSLGQNQQLQNRLFEQGGQAIPGLFGEALNTTNFTPQAGVEAAGVFGDLRQQQGQLGLQGIQAGLGGPNAGALTNFAATQGASLLQGGAPRSFNDLSAERLTALREQARPGEERAANERINRLFSTGALGTTGGANQIEALARGEALADSARITDAQNFAQGQSNIENQFFQNQQALGAGLFGQAFGGVGQDQAQAAQQGQLGAGLFGLQGGTTAAQLGAFQAADQASASRAAQRLGTAQNIFGFGNQIRQADLGAVQQGLGTAQSLDQGLLDQARLGASVGQAQAAGNANAAALGAGSSIFGGALQGIGAGIAGSQNQPQNQGGGLFAGLPGQFSGLSSAAVAGPRG